MKKIISVLFAVIFAVSALVMPASAAVKDPVRAKVSAFFRSDVAGFTEKNYVDLADLSSGNLVYRTLDGKYRISVYNCVGTPYYGKLKPGRTYEITYEFLAEDGFTLPEPPYTGENVSFSCGKGAKVNSCQYITQVPAGTSGPLLYVNTSVLADCNIFQRIIGKIADIILEIRAWSLY